VFYADIYRILKPTPAGSFGVPMSASELTFVAEQNHPGYQVTWIWPSEHLGTAEIWMSSGISERQWIYDRATARELGDANPVSIRMLNSIREFHKNLTLGARGRVVNGIGALLLISLTVTGALLWLPWRLLRPGKAAAGSRQRRIHTALGFWMVPFSAMWAATAALIIWESSLHVPRGLANAAYLLHFGAFQSLLFRGLWAGLGAVLPVLVVTGAWMSIKRARKRIAAVTPPILQTAEPPSSFYLAGPPSS
jgi:uncharacterized iron-regulated membrane protein